MNYTTGLSIPRGRARLGPGVRVGSGRVRGVLGGSSPVGAGGVVVSGGAV